MTRRDFQALRARVGTKRLAQVFGVSQATVRRWVSMGVPVKRKAAVTEFLREERAERAELRRMVKLAKETGVISPTVRRKRHREGQMTSGYELTLPRAQEVTFDSLDKLLKPLRDFRTPKKLPVWIASARCSGLVFQERDIYGGTGGRGGYVSVRVQLRDEENEPDERAEDFYDDLVFSSGRVRSKKHAVDDLRDQLEDAIDAGGLMTCNSIQILNFRDKRQR